MSNKTIEIETGKVERIELMRTPEQLKNGIKMVLHSYEESRERKPAERRLDEIWEQCYAYNDTNEQVKILLNQIVVLFQQSYDKFFSKYAEDEEYLIRLEKKTQEAMDLDKKTFSSAAKFLSDERERIRKEQGEDRKTLSVLSKNITEMAHEYRQCRTQAAFFFHISQLQQFTTLLIAILHQNITDATLLKKIADSVENASLKIFPTEVTQE